MILTLTLTLTLTFILAKSVAQLQGYSNPVLRTTAVSFTDKTRYIE